MPVLGAHTASMADLFVQFNAAFRAGWDMANPQWSTVAQLVPSSTRSNHFVWAGSMPKLREWLGARQVESFKVYDYTLQNRKFEMTIGVDRDLVEDDMTGALMPSFQEMGRSAARHPDELVFGLLKDGETELCYDGEPFFDTAHPIGDTTFSNLDAGGSGDYWYLADLSKPLKPLIFQKRREYNFKSYTDLKDRNVFERDQYEFGVDARVNAGFGLPQLMQATDQTLNESNFRAMWDRMRAIPTDKGQPGTFKPTHMIVPPSLEWTARDFLFQERLASGETNPNRNAVQLLVIEELA